MEPTGTEMKALVSLLDDPDERVYCQIREKILTLGPHAVNPLERTWALLDRSPEDDLARERIEDILQEIHFASITSRLRLWVSGGAKDLLEGALIVCRYRYQNLNEKKVVQQMESLRYDMEIVLRDNMTSFEKIRAMNHALFNTNGFKSDKRDYFNPKNSYLSSVLDTKKGNPLSLGLVYQLLAERLSIPLRGVNLPQHFVLAYMNGRDSNHADVLFYVNPFSKGDVLDKKGIIDFLKKISIPPKEEFFIPCSNTEIIRRMMDNLINSYEKQADHSRVREVRRLRSLLSTEPPK